MPSSRPSGSADNIEISDIIINSPTTITSIKLSIDPTFERNFSRAKEKSKEVILKLAVADRPSLSSSTPLIIKIDVKGVFNRPKKIQITHQDLLSHANELEYRTTVNEIQVVIGFILPRVEPKKAPDVTSGDLRPMTDEIFEICPRFRVLVIGRTGAGKSSLIHHIFGVTEAHISHDEVGECDINKELFSVDENKRFVLHDSKGFEPGDEDNFETVMKFLNDRKTRRDIKDQVHAVWLCLSIPVAGDRLFEAGAENFLRSLSEGQLGKMPIIVIFTKYDKLEDQIRFYGTSTTSFEKEVADTLEELCIRPFKEQIDGTTKIPTIAVSSEKEYKWTLHKLTTLTTELAGKYLTQDVALLSAVAQQVSPTLKVDAVIAVGKKRYWQGLASAIKLPGNKPAIVLQNIHQDIVRVWNLQDPKQLLDSDEFKGLVAAIVSKQEVVLLSMTTMAKSLSWKLIASMVPVAPIVLPIAAVGFWTIVVLKNTGLVLQRLVTYIVALTIIMQNVFVLTTNGNSVVSTRLIKIALKIFLESSQQNVIYLINEEFQRLDSHFSRDAILQKMTELLELKSNRVSPEEMAEAKAQLENIDLGSDELW